MTSLLSETDGMYIDWCWGSLKPWQLLHSKLAEKENCATGSMLDVWELVDQTLGATTSDLMRNEVEANQLETDMNLSMQFLNENEFWKHGGIMEAHIREWLGRREEEESVASGPFRRAEYDQMMMMSNYTTTPATISNALAMVAPTLQHHDATDEFCCYDNTGLDLIVSYGSGNSNSSQGANHEYSDHCDIYDPGNCFKSLVTRRYGHDNNVNTEDGYNGHRSYGTESMTNINTAHCQEYGRSRSAAGLKSTHLGQSVHSSTTYMYSNARRSDITIVNPQWIKRDADIAAFHQHHVNTCCKDMSSVTADVRVLMPRSKKKKMDIISSWKKRSAGSGSKKNKTQHFCGNDHGSITSKMNMLDSEEDLQVGHEELCPVCLEELNSSRSNTHHPHHHLQQQEEPRQCRHDLTVVLACGHSFHTDCLSPWLLQASCCPCCRAPIPSHPDPPTLAAPPPNLATSPAQHSSPHSIMSLLADVEATLESLGFRT